MTLWWLNLAGSSIGFTFASLLLKRFADTGAPAAISLALVVLGLSNVFYIQVIRSGLGQGTVASSMSQVILMAVLGFVFFGERLTPFQTLGVVFAALSIFLMLGADSLGAGGHP